MQDGQTTTGLLRFDHRRRPVLRWGACAIALLYTIYYFKDEAAPGNRLRYPEGWWGWWDQSQYLASARNLAAGNFAPDGHWYPLGYSIAAAPLVHWFPAHGFFFLDLAALLISYFAFVSFARQSGVNPILAAVLFGITAFGSSAIGEVWAEPWNSSLSAALIWSLLAVSTTLLDVTAESWRPWRLFLFGLLIGALPLVRPTDVLLSAIVSIALLIVALRARALRVYHVVYIGMAALLVIVPYGILYLRIYGLHLTPYMLHEREFGFVLNRLGWKAYQLFVEPRPWYPDGDSLLARFPWLSVSLAGLVLLAIPGPQTPRRGSLVLLAMMILPYWALFFAYVDLLPSGIWLYHNVHYLKWSFPGLALLATVFLDRLFVQRQWRSSITVLLIVLVVLSIRIVPVPTGPNGTAEMVQFAGSHHGWSEIYMGDLHFTDAAGNLRNIFDVRALPDSQGIRVLAQRRPIIGPLSWTDRPADLNGATTYWRSRLSFGYPCWLPPYPCRRLAPVP